MFWGLSGFGAGIFLSLLIMLIKMDNGLYDVSYYQDLIDLVKGFVDGELTLGEKVQLKHFLVKAQLNDEQVLGRECKTSHPVAEALTEYFLIYGISLTTSEEFIRHSRNAFYLYFNRIRDECILI